MALTGFEIGALTLGGLNFASGALGGESNRQRRANMRKEYEYAARYQPGLTSNNASASITGAVHGARAAGLHPLFALGGGTSGSAPAFNMPGQSETGSRSSDAVRGLAETLLGMQQRRDTVDLTQNQALLSAMRALEQKLNSDNKSAGEVAETAVQNRRIHPERIDPALQEFKKGEVGAHAAGPGGKQKSLNVKSLTTGIRIGDQVVQMATEDAEGIMEDPVAVIGTAMLDRNNKGIQWKKLIRDFVGMRHPDDFYAAEKAYTTITKKLLWGLVTTKRHYKIPRYMGR